MDVFLCLFRKGMRDFRNNSNRMVFKIDGKKKFDSHNKCQKKYQSIGNLYFTDPDTTNNDIREGSRRGPELSVTRVRVGRPATLSQGNKMCQDRHEFHGAPNRTSLL